MTTTTTIENRGRDVDVLISNGTPFVRVVCVRNGNTEVEMFTADELTELAAEVEKLEN